MSEATAPEVAPCLDWAVYWVGKGGKALWKRVSAAPGKALVNSWCSFSKNANKCFGGDSHHLRAASNSWREGAKNILELRKTPLWHQISNASSIWERKTFEMVCRRAGGCLLFTNKWGRRTTLHGFSEPNKNNCLTRDYLSNLLILSMRDRKSGVLNWLAHYPRATKEQSESLCLSYHPHGHSMVGLLHAPEVVNAAPFNKISPRYLKTHSQPCS